MKDRVPTYPGRVRLTPVAGQSNTYDMVRADSPTQEGTPLNKANLLTDATAALLGLSGNDPTVNDALYALVGLPARSFPYGYGMLLLKSVDTAGNAIPTTVPISPATNGIKTISTNATGYSGTYLAPGTYTISQTDNSFQSISPASSTFAIRSGEITNVSIVVNPVRSGGFDVTASRDVIIPAWLTSIDLFCVGGGGSGGTAMGATNYICSASGGAGGYTATKRAYNAASKVLSVSIGAGGAAVPITGAEYNSSNQNNANGKVGGLTSITDSGGTILSANGGNGGVANRVSASSTTDSSGGNGGSGGGGATALRAGNGGSDGSGGYSAYGELNTGSTSGGSKGGVGQGTTTRKFGETGGTLYCGGGGGGASTSSSNKAGTGGAGGGGDGVGAYTSTLTASFAAKSGSAPGAGGGGAAVRYSGTINNSVVVTSGAGANGLVSIRWSVSA